MTTISARARTTARVPSVELAPDARLRWVVPVTTIVVLSELLVLRVFTRTIIHIPGAQDASALLGLISDAGQFAYYLAVVLLVATLALLAGELARGSSVPGVGAGAIVLMFVATSAVARAGLVSDLLVALVTSGCVIALAMLVAATVRWRARLVAFCFVIAYGCATAYAVLSSVPRHGARPSGSNILLFVSEALVLAGATLSPVFVRGPIDRRGALAGIAGGLVVFGMLASNASTTKILLLWNAGLAGYFPAVAYAVAFGAFSYTVTALLRSGDRLRAVALVLVLAGGIGLHSTYQTGLVVAGLGVLALLGARGSSAIVTARPRRRACCGAILTGGASVRMGTDKALLGVGGAAMATWAGQALREAGAAPVVAVGGNESAVRELGFAYLADDHPGAGPLAAVITALRHAPVELVLVVACDLPLAQPAGFHALLDAFGNEDDAVVPLVNGQPQPLHALYRRGALNSLERCFANGERSMLAGLATLRVRYLETLPSSLFWNVNEPDDIATAETALATRGVPSAGH